LSKELVKLTTIWKNKEESAEKDNQSLLSMNNAIEAGKESIRAKEEEIAEMNKQVKELADVVAEKTSAHAASEKAHQNMCAGVTSEGDEESGTLTDQLSLANKAVSEAEEAGKQAEMTVKHMTAAVSKLKAELKVLEQIIYFVLIEKISFDISYAVYICTI
jgi:chromosome segregation ATPase